MAWSGYRYFTAIDVGLVVASFWCLMLNGFVSFQIMEDGTRLSVWVSSELNLSCKYYLFQRNQCC
jgi:Na+/H+ antiporter NhaC